MKVQRAHRTILAMAGLALCFHVPGSLSSLSAPPASSASFPEEVVLFSTSWCGYCRKARDYLNTNGIAHVEYDIEKSREGRRHFTELGGRGVPLILVGDRQIRGWNPDALKTALARARIIRPDPPASGRGDRSPPPPPLDDGDLEMSYVDIITPSTEREHRYTIHLRDQRTISVKEYWEEGDQIMYEKFGGIIGVERKDIVRIEDTAAGTTRR